MPFDLLATAGKGLENVQESSLPFIRILQKGSPEIDSDHKDHETRKIPGCEVGDLVFGPTSLLMKPPVSMIPVTVVDCMVEWRPRNQGGGIVRTYDLETARNLPDYRKGSETNELDEFNGENELIATRYIFMLVQHPEDENEWFEAILPLTKSQLKHGRQFLKTVRAFRYDAKKFGAEVAKIQPPLFAQIWKLSTEKETKDDVTYRVPRFTPERVLEPKKKADSELLEKADSASEVGGQMLAPPPEQDAPKQIAASEDEDDAF